MEKPNLKAAEMAYESFMDALLPGWREDPNAIDTPRRVAKAFAEDYLKGIYNDFPKITSFDNVDNYSGIVFSGGIEVKSMCSHHHAPFIGVAYVAYIPDPDGKIVGLSKLNRIVEHYSRRPQVQENLTQQIHDSLKTILEKNLGIAVYIKANHTCVSHRGIGQDSTMKTAQVSGYFFTNELGSKDEFYKMISDGS